MIGEQARIVESLRQATRGLHQELDSLLMVKTIIDQTSPEAYGLFLKTFHQLILSLGSYLTASSDRICAHDFDYQKWLQLIEGDLYVLEPHFDFKDLPIRNRIVSMEQFWGLSYVIEGSSMGGLALLAKWQKRPLWPTSFLGRAIGSRLRWIQFLEQLGVGSQGLDAEAIVLEAKAAFHFFIIRSRGR